MPSKKEIDSCLIMFRSSSSHDMWVDYNIMSSRLDEFCKVEKAKKELVSALRKMADRIDSTPSESGGECKLDVKVCSECPDMVCKGKEPHSEVCECACSVPFSTDVNQCVNCGKQIKED